MTCALNGQPHEEPLAALACIIVNDGRRMGAQDTWLSCCYNLHAPLSWTIIAGPGPSQAPHRLAVKSLSVVPLVYSPFNTEEICLPPRPWAEDLTRRVNGSVACLVLICHSAVPVCFPHQGSGLGTGAAAHRGTTGQGH